MAVKQIELRPFRSFQPMDRNAIGAMTMSNSESTRIENNRTGSAAAGGAAGPTDFAQCVSKAPDLPEMIRLHSELELRLQAFTEQAEALRQISRAVRSAMSSLRN